MSKATGRLQHVSSRKAFIIEDRSEASLLEPVVRAIPLVRIERILSADGEEWMI